MPMVDMSLETLRQYNGRSPKTKNIDLFWDKALKEMKTINTKVELVQASLLSSFAECYDMYFCGVGNARIHAKFARPKKREFKRPALLEFHGYSGDSWD